MVFEFDCPVALVYIGVIDLCREKEPEEKEGKGSIEKSPERVDGIPKAK